MRDKRVVANEQWQYVWLLIRICMGILNATLTGIVRRWPGGIHIIAVRWL